MSIKMSETLDVQSNLQGLAFVDSTISNENLADFIDNTNNSNVIENTLTKIPVLSNI